MSTETLTKTKENHFLRILKLIWTEYSIIPVTILIFIVSGLIAPRFIEFTNIMVILRQSAIIGIIAVGMTFVIITGGIDLSAGHAVAGAGTILILLQGNPDVPLAVAILACVGTATAIGFLNGIVITKFRVPAFIVTLAVGIMIRSIGLYLVGGRSSITGTRDPFFESIGGGSIGFMPIALIFWIVIAVVLGCVLKFTKFGSYIYAVGGNEQASKYSGISPDKTRIFAYALTGLCVGIATVIDLSRTVSVALVTTGQMYEFDAITAAVIGGTALSGGRGKMINTFFGVIIVMIISNLMIMFGISPFLAGFVKGIVILLAVLLQRREKTSI